MINLVDFVEDLEELQSNFKELQNGEKVVTKKAVCDLCIPFRDKYGLDDKTTLDFARSVISVQDAVKVLQRKSMFEDS